MSDTPSDASKSVSAAAKPTEDVFGNEAREAPKTAPGPADPLSKRRLKMWIRLLGLTRLAEGELREFLRVRHDTTLPRFDVMAALYRRREGVTMSELSRMLLVSNGNATVVVDRLEKDGLARRIPSETDRRTIFVALTPEGLSRFEILAADHEAEVSRIFAGLSEQEIDILTDILKRTGT